MFSLLLLGLLGLVSAQTLPEYNVTDQPISNPNSYCNDYYWYTEDYRLVNAIGANPISYGFTRETYPELAQRRGWTYVNLTDFETGGQYAGQNWVHVYYTQLNAGVDIRPLGFRHGRFGPSNNPTACLHSEGTAGYKVELMLYSLSPDGRLCMADMNADTFNLQAVGSAPSSCEIERVYGCFTADTVNNIMDIAVFCDTNCWDSDWTEFLWRFRKSGLSWEDARAYTSDATEMWCNMVSGDVVWPDSLLGELPNDFNGASDTDTDANRSDANIVHTLIVFTFAFFAILLQ